MESQIQRIADAAAALVKSLPDLEPKQPNAKKKICKELEVKLFFVYDIYTIQLQQKHEILSYSLHNVFNMGQVGFKTLQDTQIYIQLLITDIFKLVMSMNEEDEKKMEEIRKFSAIYGRFDCKRKPEKPLTLHEVII